MAGNERRHFHGRNSDLRRMLNSDSSSTQNFVKQVRKVVNDGGLESLGWYIQQKQKLKFDSASIKQQGADQNDQCYFNRCFHALGRTLFLAMSEAGQSVPVDFCLSLLDHIIKKGLTQQTNYTESIIQEGEINILTIFFESRLEITEKVLSVAFTEPTSTNFWH